MKRNTMAPQVNRNALPTVFGFDFQEVAGLILMLLYLKDVNKVSIEGKLQDIELVMNDGEIIYAQAKSTTKPNDSTLRAFKEGVKTLIENAQYNDYKKLIYVSNSVFPLGKKKELSTFFVHGDKEKRYTVNDFRRNGIDIDLYLDKVPNSDQEYDKEKLEIHFYKLLELSDSKTKYEVVYEYIREFLDKVNNNGRYKNEVFELWRSHFHINAAQKETLTKKDFIWKMVVRISEVHQIDSFKDYFDFDDEELIEVEERFGDVIDDLSNGFELLTVIWSEYTRYRKKSSTEDRKNRQLNFVKDYWENFQDQIIFLIDDQTTREIITKLVIWKILINRSNIKKALEVSGL